MRILCIAVNYGSDSQALELVRSLAATDHAASLEVVVVDNSESPSSGFASDVEAAFAQARVIEPERNLGYFGAARWALKEYLLDRALPDWVMVSNVDLKVADSSFFGRLEGLGGRESAVVGPAIWSSRLGRSTNPQYEVRPSARKMRFLASVFSNRLTMNLYFLGAYVKYRLRRRTSTQLDEGGPRAVYSVHGSCVLFSRTYFEAGGSLEYPCFLFGEEIFVAESARRLGLGVLYHPDMKVLHADHATTGLFRFGPVARWHGESAAYLARAFFGGER